MVFVDILGGARLACAAVGGEAGFAGKIAQIYLPPRSTIANLS